MNSLFGDEANMEEDKEFKKRKEENQETNIEEKIELCEKEKQEYLNGWKRAKADLINYKKDETKRFEEILNFGSIELIKDFIPVLDSFDLAIGNLEDEDKADKGVYMIRRQLEDVLKKRGLERIEAKTGDNFDPDIHEAVGEVESANNPGTIAEVIEKGYKLNDKVIRPARVKLSKSKSQQQ